MAQPLASFALGHIGIEQGGKSLATPAARVEEQRSQ
jgi:hypothetical protein